MSDPWLSHVALSLASELLLLPLFDLKLDKLGIVLIERCVWVAAEFLLVL